MSAARPSDAGGASPPAGLDDLTRPLGLEPPRARAPAWLAALSSPRVFAGVAIALLGALGLYVALAGDPEGGRPVARLPVPAAPDAPPRPEFAAAGETPGGRLAARGGPDAGLPADGAPATARDLEAQSGVRVHRPGGADAPGAAVVIRVPNAGGAPVRLAAAPDRRLTERGRHGTLPRIGEDGSRPSEVYARPLATSPALARAPKVAVLVGGLGIGASTTTEAIAKLPGAVSLAFAPYGNELERQAARAREEGHEIFLQVPMEPFDYPDNDPGPHTLLASAPAPENLDRLHWVMSRFPGYVGVVNHLGARFSASEAALAPVMADLGRRGLLYVDDGSSPRSTAATVAPASRLRALRADLRLDAAARADAIDAQLARLETLARENGRAVAVASALPVTVERLARWARELEGRGVELVPVSALAGRDAPPRDTTGTVGAPAVAAGTAR